MGVPQKVLGPLAGVHKMLTVVIGFTPGRARGHGATSAAEPAATETAAQATPPSASHACCTQTADDRPSTVQHRRPHY